jgi:Protein of unknown function (DUF3632)
MSQRTPEQIRHHTEFLHECTTSFDAEIAGHPPNESTKDFLITIDSFMTALNGCFSQRHDPIDFVQADLHYIWYMVIGVAKISEPVDVTHDKLVILLLTFKELGILQRKVAGVEEEAVMGNGTRVWTDLPYFWADLLDAWQTSGGITVKQRLNLAAFTGKCIALGVGGVHITLSAVWLLKNALEVDHQDEREVPIVDLLPACTALLQECGNKLLMLSANNTSLANQVPQVSAPSSASTGKPESGSLSIHRWLSWRKALQELSQSKDEAVSKEAKLGFDSMINRGREMGYVVQGEEKYWDKVMKLLSEELKRSVKKSVGLEDIVTDPQWVE